MRQPNCGRMTRSPGAVMIAMRMLASMSSAPRPSAIEPDWSTRSGNRMPLPMKSAASATSPSRPFVRRPSYWILTSEPLTSVMPVACSLAVAPPFSSSDAEPSALSDVLALASIVSAVDRDGLRGVDLDVRALELDVAAGR